MPNRNRGRFGALPDVASQLAEFLAESAPALPDVSWVSEIDFRNESKFASMHQVDGQTMCEWLSRDNKADILLVPIVFVVLVVFYFSTVFIVAAVALTRSAKNPKSPIDGAALHEVYVAKKTVQDETDFFRDAGLLSRVRTVSDFSAMTVRGAQALALFTSGVSFVTLVLLAFRSIFIPALTAADWNTTRYVTLACICFPFVGFVQIFPVSFTDGRRYRDFNVYFTGHILPDTLRGKAMICIFHAGSVCVWACLNTYAAYVRWGNGELADNTLFTPRHYFFVQAATLALHGVLHGFVLVAPPPTSDKVILGLPLFVWVFVTEIVAVVAVSVTALLAEFVPIKYCCAFSGFYSALACMTIVLGASGLIMYGLDLSGVAFDLPSIHLHSESKMDMLARVSTAQHRANEWFKDKRM
jgi:hypothetical protein